MASLFPIVITARLEVRDAASVLSGRSNTKTVNICRKLRVSPNAGQNVAQRQRGIFRATRDDRQTVDYRAGSLDQQLPQNIVNF